MQFGIYTFGDNMPDPATGVRLDPALRMRNLIEEIELADQLGIDVFALGEHHRPDYLVSAPDVVLAAAAARTRAIRLSSAVTVLSSDDPVRVFQRFATLDLISNGRAEIMAGRGSFIESFPLFGYDLGDYDTLFAEKLELLLALRDGERVTWSGRHRPDIDGLGVYPRPVQDPLPVWIAVGGTPQSIVRAGSHGLPLALAIIGGIPERFAPLVELYREAARRAGQDKAKLAVGINSHGFIAETSQAAAEIAYAPFTETMNRIGRERGWPPSGRAEFEASRRLQGALFVGSPDEVAEKILYQHEFFHHDRFLIQFTVGAIPHDKMLKSIELFGTKVVPQVRAAVARAEPDAV
ncbi:MAG: LLM class flavin-dependent oxidoreductase [Rhizobiales bacterium]|nr:LLM class flavin-dependent oxidoreductase [Hyphomicrobiales bacterium]